MMDKKANMARSGTLHIVEQNHNRYPFETVCQASTVFDIICRFNAHAYVRPLSPGQVTTAGI